MKQYGLVGYPLTHSFSKRFFTEKFEKEQVDAVYMNFEIDEVSKFPGIIVQNPELAGLNVTIPYKEQIITYLDEVDDAATQVGAVNTIKVERNGEDIQLIGFNTDTWGFENTLKPLLKDYHTHALILGTGGASKAIKYVLKKLGIQFLSATIEEVRDHEIPYTEISRNHIEDNLLIINATPLGTWPNVETYPPIPYQYITNKHLLFDLVYNPEVTKFLEKGQANGATIKNGYDMLLRQAKRSYEIWTI